MNQKQEEAPSPIIEQRTDREDINKARTRSLSQMCEEEIDMSDLTRETETKAVRRFEEEVPTHRILKHRLFMRLKQ